MLLLQRTQRQFERRKVDTFAEAMIEASIKFAVYMPFAVNIYGK